MYIVNPKATTEKLNLYKKSTERHRQSQSERIEKTYKANTNQRKVGVTILRSYKLGFRKKEYNRDFILIEVSIHQENIIILTVYEPNDRASKYVSQNL